MISINICKYEQEKALINLVQKRSIVINQGNEEIVLDVTNFN